MILMGLCLKSTAPLVLVFSVIRTMSHVHHSHTCCVVQKLHVHHSHTCCVVQKLLLARITQQNTLGNESAAISIKIAVLELESQRVLKNISFTFLQCGVPAVRPGVSSSTVLCPYGTVLYSYSTMTVCAKN